MQPIRRTLSAVIVQKPRFLSTVKERAAAAVRQSPYFRGRKLGIHFECRGEMLVVRGRVPTFHLKQLLQTLLRDIDGVSQVDNRVDVISNEGSSSVSHF